MDPDRHTGRNEPSRARVFTILVEDDPSNWGLLEAVACQWRAMQSAADLPGPYVYGVTRTICHQIWPKLIDAHST